MESLNQNQNKKKLLQLMQNFQKSTKNSSVQDLANTFTGGDSTEVFRALYCASTLCEVCDFRESKQCTIDLYDSLNDKASNSKMPTYDHSLHKKLWNSIIDVVKSRGFTEADDLCELQESVLISLGYNPNEINYSSFACQYSINLLNYLRSKNYNVTSICSQVCPLDMEYPCPNPDSDYIKAYEAYENKSKSIFVDYAQKVRDIGLKEFDIRQLKKIYK